MDYYVFKTIDYIFGSLSYINEYYKKTFPEPERELQTTYDIETDIITHQYKIEDKIYTLKIDRKTHHDIKVLVNDFKQCKTDDKILSAEIDGKDITNELNELCGPEGRHMHFSPIKISYITTKFFKKISVVDDMCMENTFSVVDDFMILD